ncbi:Acyl-coenzyme A thioesterase 9, mitochondrial [Toxocara canis]|uniref:Acyl-coenzyme A thioesterase 9, mitochondrial n=1 Tax=Toxocara canis TaxID=6265 RepID=A0A0B2VXE8_TOXCA|nr:Acyl-coenzyme A thioesterase 9, mitochondrial [Toxocara canis]
MASLLCKVFRRLQSTLQPKTIRYVGEALEKHVAALQNLPTRSVDVSELGAHTMNESRDSVLIPLGNEPDIRLQYVNIKKCVRFGKLLEDLDTFAIWLSYRHNQGGELTGTPRHHPMMIVTAAVDEIHIKTDYNVTPLSNILMEGHVSWVGRSSLEVSMHLSQKVQASGSRVDFLSAKFITVSRDPSGERPSPNVPLKATSSKEEEIIGKGLAACQTRRLKEERSLLRTQPNEEERYILHEFFLKTIDRKNHSFRHRVLPPNHVWLDDAKLKNAVICFPIDRNVYNKIFGGYLMRLAFELAWSNAAMYARGRVSIVAVDDIMFRKSVEIGSLLLLSSQVCYTVGDRMELSVHAEVLNVGTDTRVTADTFYFMFKADHDVPWHVIRERETPL